jgi:hypothetical protein
VAVPILQSVTFVMKPCRNVDTHRTDFDVLEHIGAGGVLVDSDVLVHRPDAQIVVSDLIVLPNKKRTPMS